jgi:hypothetical protein
VFTLAFALGSSLPAFQVFSGSNHSIGLGPVWVSSVDWAL